MTHADADMQPHTQTTDAADDDAAHSPHPHRQAPQQQQQQQQQPHRASVAGAATTSSPPPRRARKIMSPRMSAEGHAAAASSASSASAVSPLTAPSPSPSPSHTISHIRWHADDESPNTTTHANEEEGRRRPRPLAQGILNLAQAEHAQGGQAAYAATSRSRSEVDERELVDLTHHADDEYSAAAASLPFAAGGDTGSSQRPSSLPHGAWWRTHIASARAASIRSCSLLSTGLLQLCVYALLLVPVGMLIGVFSALFLASIDAVTHARFDQPWLLYLLPLSGALQGCMYMAWARVPSGARGFGVDYIIEQVHSPDVRKGRASVPARMGWLAWVGTLLSHLCGASVGREGTGLQLAASLAGAYAWSLRRLSCGRLRLGRRLSRVLTVSSMAAGFAGVFGTPFAGVVFSIEVLAIGSVATDAFLPAMLAAVAADAVSAEMLRAMGIHHSPYPSTVEASAHPHVRIDTLLLVALSSVLFGLVSRLFSTSVHLVQRAFKSLWVGRLALLAPALSPVVGGALLIALTYALGTRDYLGIGTLRPSDSHSVIIAQCFSAEGDCAQWSFLAKTLLTVVSLGAGYKGGEVTCLFFIGASAGYSCAALLGVPSDTQLFAAVGFVSVFGAAANTPLASTIMACELFGGTHVIYYALGCYGAYITAGQSGIYAAQRGGNKLVRARGGSASEGGGTAASAPAQAQLSHPQPPSPACPRAEAGECDGAHSHDNV